MLLILKLLVYTDIYLISLFFGKSIIGNLQPNRLTEEDYTGHKLPNVSCVGTMLQIDDFH